MSNDASAGDDSSSVSIIIALIFTNFIQHSCSVQMPKSSIKNIVTQTREKFCDGAGAPNAVIGSRENFILYNYFIRTARTKCENETKQNRVANEEHCANRSASRQIASGYRGIAKFATVGATAAGCFIQARRVTRRDIDIMLTPISIFLI